MGNNTKIAENVREFIGRAADNVGAIESQNFDIDMCRMVRDVGIDSPIEQMFWVAMHVMCRAYFEEINPSPAYDAAGLPANAPGLHVVPQKTVGKFRVDFHVYLIDHLGNVKGEALVELDGHEFHDKDKRQRSYEKARDRFLVKSGFKVLHYTGSDVVANPYKVAHEVMDTVGCFGAMGSIPYNKDDPFDNGGVL